MRGRRVGRSLPGILHATRGAAQMNPAKYGRDLVMGAVRLLRGCLIGIHYEKAVKNQFAAG